MAIIQKNISRYTNGQRYFSEDGFGGVTDFQEITLGEYEHLSALKDNDFKDFSQFVYDNYVTDSVKMGYGYYGCELISLDGVPYLGVLRGRSCD